MSSLLYRLGTVLFLLLSAGSGMAQSLDSTEDWSQVSAAARGDGLPVVVVVTGDGCGHCERMRRDLLADPETCALLNGQVVAREFHRETGGKVTDFDGEQVRSRVFLSRYQVFATPTVLFLDSKGEPLTEPLVGYSDAEAYRQLVEERLEQARFVLTARVGESAPALVDVSRPTAR